MMEMPARLTSATPSMDVPIRIQVRIATMAMPAHRIRVIRRPVVFTPMGQTPVRTTMRAQWTLVTRVTRVHCARIVVRTGV